MLFFVQFIYHKRWIQDPIKSSESINIRLFKDQSWEGALIKDATTSWSPTVAKNKLLTGLLSENNRKHNETEHTLNIVGHTFLWSNFQWPYLMIERETSGLSCQSLSVQTSVKDTHWRVSCSTKQLTVVQMFPPRKYYPRSLVKVTKILYRGTIYSRTHIFGEHVLVVSFNDKQRRIQDAVNHQIAWLKVRLWE